MIEFVRVKDKGTRHEYSITRDSYEADPDPYELLSKPATQADGTPLPPKHHILSKPTTQHGQQAGSDKENS